MRGLSVGIILTTLVLTISNSGNRPMTDMQVRQRALELGMVESDSLRLSDVAESSTQTVSEPAKETESEELWEETVSEERMENNISKEPTESSVSEKPTESRVSEEAIENSVSQEPTNSSTLEETIESGVSETPEVFILTIQNGDSSYSVSKTLSAAGFVEDAAEFDAYLCDKGYSRKIRTGNYELVLGMSYEEIAKTIAR